MINYLYRLKNYFRLSNIIGRYKIVKNQF